MIIIIFILITLIIIAIMMMTSFMLPMMRVPFLRSAQPQKKLETEQLFIFILRKSRDVTVSDIRCYVAVCL